MKTTSGSKDPTNTPDTDDGSTTFSLSALMAQGNKAKAAPPPAATKEDSGLIDLNALAAMEDSARPSPVPSHLGLFPFDAPPIAAAPVAPPPEVVEPPKPKRAWIFLGGAGAVALAVAAFYIGMNGGAHPEAASTSSQSTIEAAHTAPGANDPAKPDPDKVAAADPGAPKEKEPAPVVSAKALPAGGHGKLAKTDDKKTTADPPKDEKKAAPNDPCHGDLMCAMQRATKK